MSDGYVFGAKSCHCGACCEDCCVAFDGRSFCSPGTDGGDTWVLVSGTGLYGAEGEAYWTQDTGTEQYRFDIRWFPTNGLCGKPKFVAKSRLDEAGGAWREVEWGTYDLNPGDEGFEYGGESSGDCPTGLTAYGEPSETQSDPPPTFLAFGIESVSFCCGCTNVPHCWLIEYDYEFFDTLTETWSQIAGSVSIYIAASRNCGETLPEPAFTRVKCRDGVAVDESLNDPPNNPGDARFYLGENANGDKVWLNGIIPVCGTPTVIPYHFSRNDEWGVTPDGQYHEYTSNDEDAIVLVRGTATWTDTFPSTEAGCGCP